MSKQVENDINLRNNQIKLEEAATKNVKNFKGFNIVSTLNVNGQNLAFSKTGNEVLIINS